MVHIAPPLPWLLAIGCSLLLAGCTRDHAPPLVNPLYRVAGESSVDKRSLTQARSMDRIEALLADGLFDDAASALDQAMAEGLRHPRAAYMRAHIEQQRGNFQAAAPWLEEAIQLAPGWPEPRLRLADIYIELNRPAAAQRLYAGLEQQFPHHPAGPYGRGMISLMRGRHAEAGPAFVEALTRDPSFAPAVHGQAVLARLSDQPSRERDFLNRYRSLRPLDPGVHFRLAQLDEASELFSSARRGYLRSWELRPAPRTARALADLFIRLGDEESAALWDERSR
ncbi:MAG: hypothetical protein EA402_06045 [Planctomycetota bacterium]|nr:MAG: hypothetical protein EA402_06045 [Planctomycetota bacterium]